MSDASEVKQKDIHIHHQSGKAFILVELHNRIMAEKDAEIARLKESLEWETALKRAFLERHEEQTLEIARLNKELAAIEQGEGT